MIDRFAIIIGAMKSGTTSLFEHLARHPEICRCSEKEPGFFSDDDRYRSGRTAYEALWDFSPSQALPAEALRRRVALEASTHYAKQPRFPDCAARIAEAGISGKFIYMMRDPIERIESHLTHAVSQGWLPRPTGDAIDDHLIAVSRYAMQIDPYIKRFGADRVLLFTFEDFVDHPGHVLRRVCEFLKIDPEFEFPAPDRAFNRNRDRIGTDHGLYRAWDRVPILPRLARAALPERLRAGVRGALGTKVGPNLRLTPGQRAYTLAALSEDLARLRDAHAVDTSRWKSASETIASRPARP